jgi:hypothetical protein
MVPSSCDIGAGFAARRHAQVSDCGRALIDNLEPTGMYIASFSKACNAKVSRWEFDEDCYQLTEKFAHNDHRLQH